MNKLGTDSRAVVRSTTGEAQPSERIKKPGGEDDTVELPSFPVQ